MIDDKGILIKNIYYMLSYAFPHLKALDTRKILSESFQTALDLFAAILSIGINKLLKQGLYGEYICKYESLPILRGKLRMSETMKYQMQRQQKLACEFEDFSVDNPHNQILKTTLDYLVHSIHIKTERRHKLKKLLYFFDQVSTLKTSVFSLKNIHYHRHNQYYKILHFLCHCVMNELLPTTQTGNNSMTTFRDEYMSNLYEKFILAYYKRHYPSLHPRAREIRWNIIDSTGNHFFPVMKTDISLQNDDRILIIDAKYKKKLFQTHHGKQTFHSENLYQIYSYVKNLDHNHNGKVSGILLYAQPGHDSVNSSVNIDGNKIGAISLNLNVQFESIQKQLNTIIDDYFGVGIKYH